MKLKLLKALWLFTVIFGSIFLLFGLLMINDGAAASGTLIVIGGLLLYFGLKWRKKYSILSQEAYTVPKNAKEEIASVLERADAEPDAKQRIAEVEYDREQRERERQLIVDRKASEFDALLNSIPICSIDPSTITLSRLNYPDMPEVKYMNITKGTNRALFDRYIVVDVETTGLSPATHEIIELSAIYFESYEPMLSFSTLVKPQNSIPPEVSLIHGIFDKDVASAPSLFEIAPSFINFLHSVPVIGYNLPFDLKFIYSSGIDIFKDKRRYVDVLPHARKHAASYRFSLSDVCNSMGIFRPTSHRGLSDCLATGLVFNKLLSDYIV